VCAIVIAGCHRAAPMYTPRQMIESKIDLWGEAALRQPGGPSYEFFKDALPPLRYVDADFRCYPINLSAPKAMVKGRLVSDGSAINARARQPNWNNESGMPVRILVGPRRQAFGADLSRLDGPHYLDRYLPIAQLKYAAEDGEYRQEVFASVDPKLAERGAVLLQFDLPAANRGRIELRFEAGYELLKVDGQQHVRDSSGALLAQLDDNWEFALARSSFTNKVEHPARMYALIYTAAPAATTQAAGGGMAPELEASGAVRSATTSASTLTPEFFQRQREMSIMRWNEILASGTQIDVPEPIVMDAWRALIVAQYGILRGDQMNYSASNQYQRQYGNESGDSIRSLMFYGHTEAAGRAFKPLFEYRRPGIEIHDAAFRLEDLADYYFVTRDAQTVRSLRALWQRDIDMILSAREADGLQTREAYCSDIRQPVRSLNTNANCWRGLRDMSIVLGEIGEAEQAKKLAATCAEYKKKIVAEMESKAIDRSVDPPFVRIAFDGEEPISNPITATRWGSYWNLVIPCVLWSGIFPIDSEPADAIMHYIQRNGGLCMGLTRVQSPRGVWMNVQNIDDLYVIRYSHALLKRDEVDRALVTFYGKLAAGFTRETFIDGESTGIEPLDKFGRQIGLPPNSTANASFLLQLRNLLVQDWDMDDDGIADTLNLAVATPRRWLEDGKRIAVKNAPTAFGPVSFELKRNGKTVHAEIDLPPRKPRITRLRLRVPTGDQLIDLTGKSNHVSLSINVQ
jgi:hypothetical protein